MDDEKQAGHETPKKKSSRGRLVYFIVACVLIVTLWLIYRYYGLEPMLKMVGK